MRRLILLLAASMMLVGGCVVIEGEREPEVGPARDEVPGDGSPGDGSVPSDGDLPTASPEPLRPSSDRLLVGSLGWALLSSDIPRAVLEIDQFGGASLSRPTVDALEQTLREHGGKEEVDVVITDVSNADDVHSPDELVALTTEHRDHRSEAQGVAVHVLVLPGRFETQASPGAAFLATSMALFPDAVEERLPPGAEIAAFEAAVAVHELGHLFGLVNRTGVGAFHEDEEHPGHTGDEESVMYWAVESPSLTEIFETGPPSSFDEEDRREMEQIREQHPGS